MRSFPKEFSRVWWRLWYSGAIDKGPVYFRHLADALRARKQTGTDYYVEDPNAVCRGEQLPNWTRGFLDLTAVVSGDLRLSQKEYDTFVTKLLGKTASEADKVWQEKHT